MGCCKSCERGGPCEGGARCGVGQPLRQDGPNPINRGRALDVPVAPFVASAAADPVELNEWTSRTGEATIVSLMLDSSGAAVSTFDGLLTALVRWGVGGITRQAQMDWLPGTVATFLARHVSVSATYRAPGGSVHRTRNLASTIAAGAHPAVLRPTLTTNETIAAASTETIVLSPFARRINLVAGVRGHIDATTLIDVQGANDGGGSTLAQYDGTDAIAAWAGSGIGGLPLPGGALAVNVTNGSAEERFYRLIEYLAL